MNALTNLVDTLVNPVAGNKAGKEAKEVKEVKEVTTIKGQSLTELALHCGSELARAGKLEKEAEEIKKLINVNIKILFDAGVKVGRKGKCAIASAFHEGMISNGLTKGTADNYLKTFRDAVNEGVPIEQWNKARIDAATGTAPKPPRAPAEKSLALELLKAFNYKGGNEFKDLCFQVEKDFNDDKVKSFYAGFISFLQLHGIEIKEESSK